MNTFAKLLVGLALTSSISSYAVDTSLFDLPDQSSRTASKLGKTLDIPDLGAGASILEQQQETKIGEMVLREVGKALPLYEDAWTQDELNKVFNRIYSTTSLGSSLGLVIIEDNAINAFAVPGGLFALNTGLILSAKNIDEIAGVMGHEVAHVSQRHYSRSKDAFKHQALLTLGGMLASILLASQSSDAAGAVALGTQAALIDRQLAYSRNQEREADRVGMHFMYAAGYKPMAMADFFEVMNRKTGSVSYLPDFWLTHPLSTERMSEARLRAAQFPKIPATLDLNQEQNLRLIQYRIAVLNDQITEAHLTTAATRDPAAALALAMFYGKQGKYAQARKLAEQAAGSQPDSSIVAITRAEIELKANQPQQALDILLPQYRIMPENRALAIYTARAYSVNGQGQEALNILQPLSSSNPRDTLVWQSMEAAASRLPEGELKTLQILRFRAENLFWRGEVDSAIRSLIRARTLAKSNHSLLARIEHRLDEMQEARKFRVK
ncbi:M48 family metalloprotease [Alkanindiges sp. WGS2144]|uniref:M48 family metalloprotease n=1 Tax=Alkanindiges sp. WGS2144 TaxID=3366808 RepID=UPI0037530AE1